MEIIKLSELVSAVGGTLLGDYQNMDAEIGCVDTDSRNVRPGALFIPLVGERFDGHTYITAALEKGAAGCLTACKQEAYREDKFYIKVADTQDALRDLAVWYKSRFEIPFVAVTGSVGKTTAKDMIAAVLSTKYKVLKTEGNFNNNIGLPLTILRLTREHEVCVLEMGMDCFGEIDYLGNIVKPHVGVITNIGDAHIERLGSRENIFKAKCELLPHIRPDGLLICNGDDAMLSTLRGNTAVKTVFCGEKEGLEYRAALTGGDGISHIHCHMTTPGMDREVKVPALGAHMIYPCLIAAAVGEHLGLTADEIEEGLLSFVPTKMRMNVLRTKSGVTILDDTYNANPQSMRAAISVLADGKSEWKVAVLGDMFELGVFAAALHTSVGEYLGKVGINCLVAVGELSQYIAEGARESGVPHVYHCANKREAKQMLHEVIKPGCTVLVKASRGMVMEEISAFLLAEA